MAITTHREEGRVIYYGLAADRTAMGSAPFGVLFIETDTASNAKSYIGTGNGTTWLGPFTAAAVGIGNEVSLTSVISGERNPTSATESWLDVRTEVIPVVLTPTTAVAIGGSTIADDRHLMGLVILANAVAVTATVAGFQNEVGVAKSLVFTGVVATDTFIPFGGIGLRNNKGILQVTASVADKVVVLYRTR